MTRDDVIDLARQAGIMSEVLKLGRNLELLTDFAKLVAAKERESLRESFRVVTAAEASAAILHEREACAKVCESEWSNIAERMYGKECADAIRARGEA